MIEELFKQLGFAEKEIQVYLAILTQGKTTPANLAKITGINRTTVYSIAKELVTKGVIIEDIAGPKTHLVALPPEDLKNLIKREERAVQEKKVLIDQVINELQDFAKTTKYSIPKITFIYEEDLEDFLFKQTVKWNESALTRDKMWWGFQDPSFVMHFQKWIDWYWTKSAPPELTLKLLTNDSAIEKEMSTRKYEKRQVKLWEKGANFSATTWITGDYLTMIMTDRKPFYLVQIHDATIAHNMREVFKGIWSE